MNRLRSIAFNPVRFLIAAVCCALVMVSYSAPSFAQTSTKSHPTDGTVQLSDIEKRAEDVAQKPLSPQAYQARAQKGINEVQGAADADKMSRPENAQHANTVLDVLKDGLDNITNQG